MKIATSEVRSIAMSRPGMWQDFLAVGKLAGDQLEISREDFDRLQEKWFPGLALGTVVHEALKPVVKIVDAVLGTDLKNCGGCAERQMKMNAATSSP
jgi:hypothetical protein